MNQQIWSARRQARTTSADGDVRHAYQRDKARIMHAASFRRLQAKTQVVGIGVGDFYRTRLTHSLEAAQIGTGIITKLKANQPTISHELNLDEYLIEAICLAHDIGHPPFGHGGEVALHYMMLEYGGFEGNGQTFRILTKLESYTKEHGMNLARRTLLGVIKYPGFLTELDAERKYPARPDKHSKLDASQWVPPKGLFLEEVDANNWVLSPLSHADKQRFQQTILVPQGPRKTIYKSVDCSIMELADDIAYAVHDLEDAIVMQLVDRFQFNRRVTEILSGMQITGLSERVQQIEDALFAQEGYLRKNMIGYLVNEFISQITLHKQQQFDDDILDYVAVLPNEYAQALAVFKQFVFEHVIRKPEIQIHEYKGQQIIMSMFEVFANEPVRLLPENTARRWSQAGNTNQQMRVIADYIAGMTDQYANRCYANLFFPRT